MSNLHKLKTWPESFQVRLGRTIEKRQCELAWAWCCAIWQMSCYFSYCDIAETLRRAFASSE